MALLHEYACLTRQTGLIHDPECFYLCNKKTAFKMHLRPKHYSNCDSFHVLEDHIPALTEAFLTEAILSTAHAAVTDDTNNLYFSCHGEKKKKSVSVCFALV